MNWNLDRVKSFAIVILPLLTLIAAFVFLIEKPIATSKIALEARIDRLDAEIKRLEVKKRNLASSNAVPQATANILWNVETNRNQQIDIQTAIDRMAADQGILVGRIGPHQVSNAGAFRQFSVLFEADMRYSQLIALLSQIGQSEPPLAISNLAVRPLPQRKQEAGHVMISVRAVIWGYGAS